MFNVCVKLANPTANYALRLIEPLRTNQFCDSLLLQVGSDENKILLTTRTVGFSEITITIEIGVYTLREHDQKISR